MRLIPSDIIAIGTLILGGFIAMKMPKKVIGWLMVFVAGAYLFVSLFTSDTKNHTSDNHIKTATTSGDNSPAYVAGRDINIQNGVQNSTLQQVLNLKDVELSERILNEFTYGCIIVGLQNGKVIYEPRLKDIQVTFDPDSITFFVENGIATIQISSFSIFVPQKGVTFSNIGIKDYFQFKITSEPIREHTMLLSAPVPSIYYQVLDVDKKIFIIGFK